MQTLTSLSIRRCQTEYATCQHLHRSHHLFLILTGVIMLCCKLRTSQIGKGSILAAAAYPDINLRAAIELKLLILLIAVAALLQPIPTYAYGEDCLSLGAPSGKTLSSNSTYADHSWKVSVTNSCSEPLTPRCSATYC